MTRRRLRRIALSGLVLLAAPATAGSGATLCAAAETALFSCPVGARVVSICGLPGGGAEYRYGRPGRIELTSRALRHAETGFSGGGEQQVWFDHQGYRYVVYDRLIRTNFGASGRHDPQAETGLFVLHRGRAVAQWYCRGAGGFVSGVARHMPPGDYNPAPAPIARDRRAR